MAAIDLTSPINSPDHARVYLATQATWEIEGLLQLLIKSNDLAEVEPLVIRGILIRASALTCAAMSALGDMQVDAADLYYTVHGRYQLIESESAHG